MTVQTKTYLKSRFETRDIPTEQDYIDLIDSFVTLDGSNQSFGGALTVSGQFNFIATADSSVRASIGPNRAMFLTKVSAEGGLNTTTVSAANMYATSARVQGLTVDDNIVLAFVSLAASGSAQGTANVINAPMVRVINASAGVAAGIRLPASTPIGDIRRVFNRSTDNLNVYPETGAQINLITANNPYVVSASAEPTAFYRASSTQWYSGR